MADGSDGKAQQSGPTVAVPGASRSRSSMPYRPEIDGLRAIAVLAVVFYHVELPAFGRAFVPGGYLGVDIFFVISGYLITGILLRELHETGRISFLNFYHRRVRRLIPVLLTVILASLPFAHALLLPPAFVDFSESVFASLFFFSNFYFYFSGLAYNAEVSALAPFLHTWSLSVEEQFYLLFPGLALILHNRPGKLAIVIALGLASLAYAHMTAQDGRDLAFYSSVSRFWELMTGSALAIIERNRGRRPGALGGILAAAGLVLICLSFAFFNDATTHPALLTVLPIGATAALIFFATPGNAVGRLLASAPFVGMGKISYSVYLWHFPLFAFARMTGRLTDWSDAGILIFCTICLSVLSWLFVEQPFRQRKVIGNGVFFPAIAGVTALVVVANLQVVTTGGLPSRLPPILAELNDPQSTTPGKTRCTAPDRPAGVEPEKNVILLGDSHMGMFRRDLTCRLEADYQIVNYARGACFPLPGYDLYRQDGSLNETCTADIQRERLEAITSADPSIVILAGRLQLYLENRLYDNGEGGRETPTLRWHEYRPLDPVTRMETVIRTTIMTILEAGHDLVLVYPVPETGWNIPEKLNRDRPKTDLALAAFLEDTPLTTSFDAYAERTKAVFALYDSIDHPRIKRVYPHRLFCNTVLPGRCMTHDRDHIYYSDTSHLSYYASGLVNNEIIEAIRKIDRERNARQAARSASNKSSQ